MQTYIKTFVFTPFIFFSCRGSFGGGGCLMIWCGLFGWRSGDGPEGCGAARLAMASQPLKAGCAAQPRGCFARFVPAGFGPRVFLLDRCLDSRWSLDMTGRRRECLSMKKVVLKRGRFEEKLMVLAGAVLKMACFEEKLMFLMCAPFVGRFNFHY